MRFFELSICCVLVGSSYQGYFAEMVFNEISYSCMHLVFLGSNNVICSGVLGVIYLFFSLCILVRVSLYFFR